MFCSSKFLNLAVDLISECSDVYSSIFCKQQNAVYIWCRMTIQISSVNPYQGAGFQVCLDQNLMKSRKMSILKNIHVGQYVLLHMLRVLYAKLGSHLSQRLVHLRRWRYQHETCVKEATIGLLLWDVYGRVVNLNGCLIMLDCSCLVLIKKEKGINIDTIMVCLCIRLMSTIILVFCFIYVLFMLLTCYSSEGV